MRTNIIYIHICTIGVWKKVLTHLLSVIQDSGLSDIVTEIRLGILGDPIEVVHLLLDTFKILYHKTRIIFHSPDITLYERPTLEHLRQASESEVCNILYLHTKGISSKNDHIRIFIQEWIDMMLYFLVYGYSTCLQLLYHHPTIGCNVHTNVVNKFHQLNATTSNKKHYSGNFWWANSEYVRLLPSKIGAGYIDPELWIGIAAKELYSLYQPKINFYIRGLPHDNYCQDNVCCHKTAWIDHHVGSITPKRRASLPKDFVFQPQLFRDGPIMEIPVLKNNFKLKQLLLMRVNIVYIHACTIENWDQVLSHLLNAIINSGLINEIMEIRLGVLGDAQLVEKLINNDYTTIRKKVKIIFNSPELELYERPTLEHIRISSETEQFNVLYLHTKGIRSKNKEWRSNIQMWIDMMLHFLVYEYTKCLTLLNQHTSVGCNLYTRINPKLQKEHATTKSTRHYSGNFWWATSEHIKALPEKIGSGYLDPELWIGSGPNSLYSVHQPKINSFYFQAYPRNRYSKTSLEPPINTNKIIAKPIPRLLCIKNKKIQRILTVSKKHLIRPHKRGKLFYATISAIPKEKEADVIKATPIKRSEQSKPVKYYIYFHICTINKWVNVVTKLYDKICTSGLIDIVEKINVVVLGNEVEQVKEILAHPKVNIIYHSTNIRIFERKCLQLLREHAQKENFKVLYIHSKGITKKRREAFINDWIDYMIYFNIEKYPDCIKVLDEYDCCGVNLLKITNARDLKFVSNITRTEHFSGNFWWATSNYISQLPETVGPKYLDPEIWIGDCSKKKMYSFWQSDVDHYVQIFPLHMYTGPTRNQDPTIIKT